MILPLSSLQLPVPWENLRETPLPCTSPTLATTPRAARESKTSKKSASQKRCTVNTSTATGTTSSMAAVTALGAIRGLPPIPTATRLQRSASSAATTSVVRETTQRSNPGLEDGEPGQPACSSRPPPAPAPRAPYRPEAQQGPGKPALKGRTATAGQPRLQSRRAPREPCQPHGPQFPRDHAPAWLAAGEGGCTRGRHRRQRGRGRPVVGAKALADRLS